MKKKSWTLIVIPIVLVFVIMNLGAFLIDAPKTRVFEANVCLRYYQRHDPSNIGSDGTVPEAECKIDAVQQELAMIFGWQDMFDALSGMLLAVPFGALADTWGRKWIFAAALMGLQLGSAWVLLVCYLQSLPLQWTWLSSMFSVIGGGSTVAVAVGMTMISDATPPDKRTNMFLITTASAQLGEIISPILASRLMEKSDWHPLLLAFAIQLVGITTAIFCPETMRMQNVPDTHTIDGERVMEMPRKKQEFGFKAQLGHFRDAFVFLKNNHMIILIVFSYFGNRFGIQAIQLLLRYASKRYSWEIKKTALLLSFRATTNLLSTAVLISGMNYILLNYIRIQPRRADVWLARASIILLALSFFIMGVAFTPVLLIISLLIYNLGTGYASVMRSIAIHVLGGQSSPDIGKLMSLLAITENIGLLISGPLVNKMLQWGMNIGPAWLGLPFLGVSVLYGAMIIVTFIISVTEKHVEYEEITSDEEEGEF